MNRKEHLQWCKDRALKYVKNNDLQGAWASMSSDLQKHQETENHLALTLGTMMMMSNQLSTAPKMQDFIEGFN